MDKLTEVRGPDTRVTKQVRQVGHVNPLSNELLELGVGIGSNALRKFGEERGEIASIQGAIKQGEVEAISDETAAKKRNWISRHIFGENPEYAGAIDRSSSNKAARMSREVAVAANNPENANMTTKEFSEKFLEPMQADIAEEYKGDVRAFGLATDRFRKGVTHAVNQQALHHMDWTQEEEVRQSVEFYDVESNAAVQMMSSIGEDKEQGYAELVLLGDTDTSSPEASKNNRVQSTVNSLMKDNTTQYKVWKDTGVFEKLNQQQQQALTSAVTTADTRHNSRMSYAVYMGINTAMEADTPDEMLYHYNTALKQLTELKVTSTGSDASKKNYEIQRGKLIRAQRKLYDDAAKNVVEQTSSELKFKYEQMLDRDSGEALEATLTGTSKKEDAETDAMHMSKILYNSLPEHLRQDYKAKDIQDVEAHAITMSLTDGNIATQMGMRFATNQRVPEAFADGISAQIQVIASKRRDDGKLTSEALTAMTNIKRVNKASGGRLFNEMGEDAKKFGILDRFKEYNEKQYLDYSQKVLEGTTQRVNVNTLGIFGMDMNEWLETTFNVHDSASKQVLMEYLQEGLDVSGHGGQAKQWAKDRNLLKNLTYQGNLITGGVTATEALRESAQRMINDLPNEVSKSLYDKTNTIPLFNILDVLKTLEGTDEMKYILEQGFSRDTGYRKLSDIPGGYTLEWDTDIMGGSEGVLILRSPSSMRGTNQIVIYSDQLMEAYSNAFMKEHVARQQAIKDARSHFPVEQGYQ